MRCKGETCGIFVNHFFVCFLPIVLMLYYIIHPNLRNIFCSQQEVYVQLVGQNVNKTYTTEQTDRPDVADAYENNQYTQSGFAAKIPIDQLEVGSYSLEIFLKYGARVASENMGTIELLANGAVNYIK